jgi:ribosomal protein S18 acetylase RimI-like enzyme
MNQRPPAEPLVRPAQPSDADALTRVYLESAHYHAGLDPGRYWIPDAQAISARYREGRQHPPESAAESITLVAEADAQIVGFVDARLTQSPDPMHREMLYCHIVEIAVSTKYQGRGVGAQLLRAAEDWGRKQGAEMALLEYLAANQRAALFYERLGYRPGSINAIKPL